MTGPLVSVVTPFYNTAAYLDECIASVLAQTYGNFEYVLLDNHSDDGSSEIAARWAGRDPRIKLSRNPTLLPQVPNYNHALSLISSESRWVKMVQADDLIFPRCLEEMVAAGESAPTVALISSYYLMGRRLMAEGLAYTVTTAPGKEVCRMHHRGAYLFGSPTTVMYRADLVRARAPFYSLGRYHEDTEAAYEILGTHDFGFVHQVLSFIRVDEESIMGKAQAYGPDRLDHLITLKQFGPRDLPPEEYRRRLADEEDEYYRFLAKRRLSERNADFLDYHRRGLATIGETIDGRKLTRYVLMAIGDKVLAPKQALEWLVRRGRRRERG